MTQTTNATTFAYLYDAYIKSTNSAAQNELAMMQLANAMGLTFSKGNSTFTSWTRLGLNSDGTAVVNNPCNN